MMPISLTPDLFSRVQPLFSVQARHHLFCAGVLAGKYAGQVIVDDPDQPRSAMVLKGEMWAYLGGDAHNAAFNQGLGAALAAKQFVGEQAWGVLFNVPSTAWRQVLDTLVPERQPIATPRFLYVANAGHFQAPPPAPDGFSLCFIDESLPGQIQGEMPADVQNVLNLRANSRQPDQTAFGYVALHDHACVSWSVVDCIVGAHGEIGLETKPNYQQRGLGMATSGATIKYGLSHGLTDIHWDVVSYNTPSVRMAGKHGLQLLLEYDQNLIIFGQVSYLANLAWDHLDRGRFQATLEVCAQLLALENGQKYGHFLSGAAWGGLGNEEKAFFHLHRAVDHGWDDAAEIENSAPLQGLRGTGEWEALRARLLGDNS